MWETIIGLGKEYILDFFALSKNMLSVMFVALGFIYIIGRMFKVQITQTGKNRLATIVIFVLFAVQNYFNGMKMPSILLTTFIQGCICCVFYVTIGCRFYDRADNLLDRVFGKDKGKPKK